jgi:hypothetical protein
MSNQGTAGKKKNITLIIYQNLEITRRLGSGKTRKEVMASYNIG